MEDAVFMIATNLKISSRIFKNWNYFFECCGPLQTFGRITKVFGSWMWRAEYSFRPITSTRRSCKEIARNFLVGRKRSLQKNQKRDLPSKYFNSVEKSVKTKKSSYPPGGAHPGFFYLKQTLRKRKTGGRGLEASPLFPLVE